ncbi:MAG: hypothetical protein ACTHMM_16850 [Agriterribacter sp.]
MVIHLAYKDEYIKGVVTYRSAAIKNVVMVKLEKEIPGLKKDILLFYEPSGWHEANGMHSKHPELYNQLLTRLRSVLEKCCTSN